MNLKNSEFISTSAKKAHYKLRKEYIGYGYFSNSIFYIKLQLPQDSWCEFSPSPPKTSPTHHGIPPELGLFEPSQKHCHFPQEHAKQVSFHTLPN